MLMSFLGTIVLGLGVAGTWMLLMKALRIPAPRWTVPTLGGVAMLVFHVYIEYSWFQRTAATLPARAVVADTGTYRHPLQPWTLLVPQVNRFTVLDTGRIRTHADQPEVVWAEVAFVTRYYPTMRSQQLYDCARPRRADILPSTSFGADGMPEAVTWIELAPDDAVRAAACRAADIQRGQEAGSRPILG